MDKIYIESMSALTNIPFTVENITMMRDTVEPPAYFKVPAGKLRKSRFFYVKEGTMIAKKGKEILLTATKGDIIYLPNDIVYESEWELGTNGEYITFECNFFTKSNQEINFNKTMFVVCNDKTEKYLNMMLEMYGFFSRNSTNSFFQLMSIVFSFVGNMIDEYEKKQLKKDATSQIYKGIRYINDNYCLNTSISDIAKMCNVSESTFRRKFHAHFGMTPNEYIAKLKIQKAKELLQSGIYNSSEVADFLNFYDTAHFNKFFKRYCGVTPSKYLG